MNDTLTGRDLVKIAGMIHENLRLRQAVERRELEKQIDLLFRSIDSLRSVRRKLQRCRELRFLGAAATLQEQLAHTLRQLPYGLTEIEKAQQAIRGKLPRLGDIYLELKQTQEEFCQLRYDHGQVTIGVTTDPIELEGIYLGEFEICLHIAALSDTRETPYSIHALDPHPAASNEVVTHPHVSDGRMCAGDATATIRNALASGRVFDFFCLARSVLLAYNPGSPFVSLDDWDGVSCRDCGYVANNDHCYWCEGCEHEYCEECISFCCRCDEPKCSSCLTTCPACENGVCDVCAAKCPNCERTLC